MKLTYQKPQQKNLKMDETEKATFKVNLMQSLQAAAERIQSLTKGE
jgi:hypothetical protein